MNRFKTQSRMAHRSHARILTLVLAALPLAWSPAALAQDQVEPAPGTEASADSESGNEIFVTARKREESLMDVPVAMQVFNEESLERYGTKTLTELAEQTTQVQLLPTSSGGGALFVVRGVSSSTLDPGVDTSVALNIDGVGISRGRVIRQAMFDVEAVEVLRGPQALFFGKNSPAGVISLRSAQPTSEWEGKLRTSYELHAREVVGEAMISGPITDTLGIRLAYQGGTSRGWVKNVAIPTAPTVSDPFLLPGALERYLGGYEEHMARLTLAYEPTDNFEAVLRVLGSVFRGDATASLNEVIHCAGAFPSSAGLLDTGGDCRLNGVVSSGRLPLEFQPILLGLEDREDTRSFNDYDSVIGSLNLEYDAGSFNLTSVTGLYAYKSESWDTFDATRFARNTGRQTEDSTTISQELRLLTSFDGPLNFLVGGFYERYTNTFFANGQNLRAVDPVTGKAHNYETLAKQHATSASVFGQVIANLTDDIEITAGARYTQERRRLVAQELYVNPAAGAAILPVGVVLRPRFRDNQISPEATITWEVSPDLTLYGAYKTGYKTGGFSAQVFYGRNATAQSLVFNEESVNGFEAGLRSNLLDGRMTFNATAYQYTFRDLQDATFDAPTLSGTIFNADARVRGVEAEMNFEVSDVFTLRANAGYNNSRYLSFRNAPCFSGQTAAEGCNTNTTGLGGPTRVQDISGRTRPFAPRFTGSLGGNLDVPINTGLNFAASADASYNSGYLTQVQNAPFSKQDDFFLINAAVRVHTPDDGWEIALIGRNLLNQLYVGATSDKPAGTRGDIVGQVIRGRQISLQGTVRF